MLKNMRLSVASFAFAMLCNTAMSQDTIEVDYGTPFCEFVEGSGLSCDATQKEHYQGWFESPGWKKARVEFETRIFKFPPWINFEKAVNKMTRKGFYPANFEQLVAYNTALGNDDGYRVVAALDGITEMDHSDHTYAVPTLWRFPSKEAESGISITIGYTYVEGGRIAKKHRSKDRTFLGVRKL